MALHQIIHRFRQVDQILVPFGMFGQGNEDIVTVVTGDDGRIVQPILPRAPFANDLHVATQSNVVDQEIFHKVMARFVELANDLQAEYSPQLITTAMNYATSRYSTYVVARSVSQGNEMVNARGDAEKFFFEQYKSMFKENFDDYVAHYDAYMKS